MYEKYGITGLCSPQCAGVQTHLDYCGVCMSLPGPRLSSGDLIPWSMLSCSAVSAYVWLSPPCSVLTRTRKSTKCALCVIVRLTCSGTGLGLERSMIRTELTSMPKP